MLDSNLRLPIDCKLLKNYRAGAGRRPWILCLRSTFEREETRVQEMLSAGAAVHPVDDSLNVSAVLSALHRLGVRSVMVEGGARVIQSFLAAQNAVNTLIVTVAPTIVGNAGVGYAVDLVCLTFSTAHSN